MRRSSLSISPKLAVTGLVAAAALAAPALASAHVTVQPPQAVAGSYSVLNVRVPNEKDNEATTKVEVRFPAGFPSASYQPVAGWKVQVRMRKAAKPITVHGAPSNEEVDTVTWTAADRRAGIAPGQFRDFPLSVAVPQGTPGTKLTFKALQTYDADDVVRWIGAPDSPTPAPQLTLLAAPAASAAPATPPAASDDGGGSSTVAIVLGALGLVAGLAGLGVALRVRRRVAG